MPKGPEAISSLNSREEAVQMPAATEEVIGDFAHIVEENRDSLANPEERRHTFTLLHRTLDRFENHEIKVMYDEGRVPTFESIARSTETAQVALERENDPEAAKIAKLLSGQSASIKRWCRQYVASLLRFRTSHIAFARMNDDERRDALERADQERRRVHESLLQSLTTLDELLRKGTDYADYQTPLRWQPPSPLPEGSAYRGLIIFGKEALADRDLIRDWAIVADRIEEIRKITGFHEAAK